ncbi:hypothetical protein CEUSTIGMA_g6776.t1 [Chlamydomonas eustigma]|uniref:Chloride channel protein n=1 Tax=Chlamydomonas eustigma TaxID=1157962 RepID=A0A250X8D7_9CHLO|nr:hypothetical protein CEUSTIGMA_g6776.t1 [Chlamydomonas eustigma]|eukprot:GAX79335.1 hypothetical protein CEUSTIGMA_g6776.t1 [Chlamydomonas eustigma]
MVRQSSLRADVSPGGLITSTHEAQSRIKKMQEFTSDDYDLAETDLHRELLLGMTKGQFNLEQVAGWFMCFAVGFSVGLLAFFFNWGIVGLSSLKFNTTKSFISPDGGFAAPFFIFLSFSALYGTVAGLCGTYFSPQAAGSGIPELKGYLNGIHVKGLLTIRTFLAKAFGVSFAIASGLFAGKEGPFIHVGAIIGGGVSGLGSQSVTRWTGGRLQAKLRSSFSTFFCSPVDHREFVAAGAASGIAAAFGAPIGGVLFALEEGSSFFTHRMMWYAVVACAMALYVTEVLTFARGNGGNIWRTMIMAPQVFTNLAYVTSPIVLRLYYYFWEMLIFIVMGAIGGVLGALLVVLHAQILKFRIAAVPRVNKLRRLLEVILLTLVTSGVFFIVTYSAPCQFPPTAQYEYRYGSGVEAVYVPQYPGDTPLPTNLYLQLWCPKGKYNAYAALFFQPMDQILASMMQLQSKLGEPFLFYPPALALLFVVGYCFMVVSYGIGAPTGLFIPCLVVGAAGGRLMGRASRAFLVSLGATNLDGTPMVPNQSTYAAVGAAAVLGGVRRRLLSVAVIVMETTNSMTAKSPIIMATLVAKIVGDLLTIGVYDFTLRWFAMPYLESQPRELTELKLQTLLSAEDVMTANPDMMPAIIRVRDLVHVLRQSPHSTYPLYMPDNDEEEEGAEPPHDDGHDAAVVCRTLAQSSAHSFTSSARRPTLILASTPRSHSTSHLKPNVFLSHNLKLQTSTATTTSPKLPSPSSSSIPPPTSDSLQHQAPPISSMASALLNPCGSEGLGATKTLSSFIMSGRLQQRLYKKDASSAPPWTTAVPSFRSGASEQHTTEGGGGIIHRLPSNNMQNSAMVFDPDTESGPGMTKEKGSGMTGSIIRNSTKVSLLTPSTSLKPEAMPESGLWFRSNIASSPGPTLSAYSSYKQHSWLAMEPVIQGAVEGEKQLPVPAISNASAYDSDAAPVAEGQEGQDRSNRFLVADAAPVAEGREGQGSSTRFLVAEAASTCSGQLPVPMALPEDLSEAQQRHNAHLRDRMVDRSSDNQSASSCLQQDCISRPAPRINGRSELPTLSLRPSSYSSKITDDIHGNDIPDLRGHADDTSVSRQPVGSMIAAVDNSLNKQQSIGLIGWDSRLKMNSSGGGVHSMEMRASVGLTDGMMNSSNIRADFYDRGEQGDDAKSRGDSSQHTIVGIISRPTILKLLEQRLGFHRPVGQNQRYEEMGSVERVRDKLRKLDRYPIKAPTTQVEQERLFSSLREEELDLYLNLSHYMQRVPYVVPANTSLSRTYRLFRQLGLHHLLVTNANVPVVGLITRQDLTTEKAELVLNHKVARQLLNMRDHPQGTLGDDVDEGDMRAPLLVHKQGVTHQQAARSITALNNTPYSRLSRAPDLRISAVSSTTSLPPLSRNPSVVQAARNSNRSGVEVPPVLSQQSTTKNSDNYDNSRAVILQDHNQQQKAALTGQPYNARVADAAAADSATSMPSHSSRVDHLLEGHPAVPDSAAVLPPHIMSPQYTTISPEQQSTHSSSTHQDISPSASGRWDPLLISSIVNGSSASPRRYDCDDALSISGNGVSSEEQLTAARSLTSGPQQQQQQQQHKMVAPAAFHSLASVPEDSDIIDHGPFAAVHHLLLTPIMPPVDGSRPGGAAEGGSRPGGAAEGGSRPGGAAEGGSRPGGAAEGAAGPDTTTHTAAVRSGSTRMEGQQTHDSGSCHHTLSSSSQSDQIHALGTGHLQAMNPNAEGRGHHETPEQDEYKLGCLIQHDAVAMNAEVGQHHALLPHDAVPDHALDGLHNSNNSLGCSVVCEYPEGHQVVRVEQSPSYKEAADTSLMYYSVPHITINMAPGAAVPTVSTNYSGHDLQTAPGHYRNTDVQQQELSHNPKEDDVVATGQHASAAPLHSTRRDGAFEEALLPSLTGALMGSLSSQGSNSLQAQLHNAMTTTRALLPTTAVSAGSSTAPPGSSTAPHRTSHPLSTMSTHIHAINRTSGSVDVQPLLISPSTHIDVQPLPIPSTHIDVQPLPIPSTHIDVQPLPIPSTHIEDRQQPAGGSHNLPPHPGVLSRVDRQEHFCSGGGRRHPPGHMSDGDDVQLRSGIGEQCPPYDTSTSIEVQASPERAEVPELSTTRSMRSHRGMSRLMTVNSSRNWVAHRETVDSMIQDSFIHPEQAVPLHHEGFVEPVAVESMDVPGTQEIETQADQAVLQ